MQLNPAAFNQFLDGIGQTFRWRRSYACPCVNPNSKAAKPGCPHCGGKGRIWIAPVDAMAGVASQKVQARWAQMGMYEAGDLVLAVQGSSSMWDMGQFDRVTTLNATDQFSTALTRGAPHESLRFDVAIVERVFWISADVGTPIVEGGIPTIDAGGLPSWPGGDGPPAGTTYSITGTKYLDFYVFDQMPRNRSEHHGARLPKAMVLRKWDLIGRGLSQGYA